MDIFTILADPTRRSIIEMLADGESTAGEICANFETSQPGISRHLRVLREAGVVRSTPRAQQRVYSLETGKLAEVDEWLERYRIFWKRRLDDLGTLLLKETDTGDQQ